MLLEDLPARRRPSDRPEQFVADPELKQTASDEDVAGAPAVVLAHTDVLRVDADDAVARHAPGDPLLAVALRRSSQLPGLSWRLLNRLSGVASSSAWCGR